MSGSGGGRAGKRGRDANDSEYLPDYDEMEAEADAAQDMTTHGGLGGANELAPTAPRASKLLRRTRRACGTILGANVPSYRQIDLQDLRN